MFEWLPGEAKSAPLEVFQQGLASHLAGMPWKEFLHRVKKQKILSHPQDSGVLFVIAWSRGKIIEMPVNYLLSGRGEQAWRSLKIMMQTFRILLSH